MSEETQSKSRRLGGGAGQIVLVALLSLLGAAAGAAGSFYFLLSKHDSGSPLASPSKQEPQKTKQIVFEPMLVNLADTDGAAYLRIGVVLNVVDDPSKKESSSEDGKGAHPEVRDAVLEVLTRFHSTELITEDGKAEIKTKIREVLKEKEPSLNVHDVYFTDFLVQR